MPNNPYFLIVIIVVMVALMAVQMRSAKKQQKAVEDFRQTLAPGTLVMTIGGIIGTVVSVDEQYEEIVINSEGSLLRFTSKAINKEYVRPAYVDDSEVDEEGNPLVESSDAANTEADIVEREDSNAAASLVLPTDNPETSQFSGESADQTSAPYGAQSVTTEGLEFGAKPAQYHDSSAVSDRDTATPFE